MQSPLVGPTGSFQCRLHVYPGGGSSSADTDSSKRVLSTYIVIVPPKHLEDDWSCADVAFWIWVQRGDRTVSRSWTFSFGQETNNQGWHDFLHGPPLQDFVNSNGELRVQGQVSNLPYVQPPAETSKPLFPGLDFCSEAKMLSFRLAEGPSLFFDQRLLMARSEYFRTMLASDEWKESRKGEVDFTGDPHVTKQIMQSILHFILSDSFEAGFVEFNLEVRKLADRFLLKSLVEKVDAAMTDMLNEDNVLKILSEMHDTDSSWADKYWSFYVFLMQWKSFNPEAGCRKHHTNYLKGFISSCTVVSWCSSPGVVEKSCWTMLESDSAILAQHEDLLPGLVAAKPDLATKLILLGRKKRPRKS